jgi:hypothetical protein
MSNNADSMKKQEIGAFWHGTTEEGEKMLSGKIYLNRLKPNVEEINVLILKNQNQREGINDPRCRMYIHGKETDYLNCPK